MVDGSERYRIVSRTLYLEEVGSYLFMAVVRLRMIEERAVSMGR